MKVRDCPDDNQSIIRTTEAILKLTNNGEHPITYSDSTVELGGVSSRSLGAPLNKVQEACSREKYPCPSVMVGYKSDCLMPGKGFYISSARHYQNQTGIYAEDIPKIRKVVKRTNWKPFLKRSKSTPRRNKCITHQVER